MPFPNPWSGSNRSVTFGPAHSAGTAATISETVNAVFVSVCRVVSLDLRYLFLTLPRWVIL
jgi:hypothetical protein